MPDPVSPVKWWRLPHSPIDVVRCYGRVARRIQPSHPPLSVPFNIPLITSCCTFAIYFCFPRPHRDHLSYNYPPTYLPTNLPRPSVASWLTTSNNIRHTAPNLLKAITTAKRRRLVGNSILHPANIPTLRNRHTLSSRHTVRPHLHTMANTGNLPHLTSHTEGVRRRESRMAANPHMAHHHPRTKRHTGTLPRTSRAMASHPHRRSPDTARRHRGHRLRRTVHQPTAATSRRHRRRSATLHSPSTGTRRLTSTRCVPR